MASGVVDLLQSVDIANDERDFLTVDWGPLEDRLKFFFQNSLLPSPVS